MVKVGALEWRVPSEESCEPISDHGPEGALVWQKHKSKQSYPQLSSSCSGSGRDIASCTPLLRFQKRHANRRSEVDMCGPTS